MCMVVHVGRPEQLHEPFRRSGPTVSVREIVDEIEDAAPKEASKERLVSVAASKEAPSEEAFAETVVATKDAATNQQSQKQERTPEA